MEPPAKVSKFEMESQYLEGEVMEEGQEEWLSEGILTDDDYNPSSQEAQADNNDSTVVSSQDESMNTEDDSQNQMEDGENNLDDSQNQLDDGQNQLDDGQNQLDDSQNQLDDSQTHLDDSHSQNLDSQSQQEDSQSQLESSQSQLEASQSQMENSLNQINVSQNMDFTSVSNIEETLNNLENSEPCDQTSDLPEELNAFLIRKTDGKVISSDPPKKESDIDESVKQSDDDGNDTDDLLRVLGDGDQLSKHIKKEKMILKSEHGDFSDGDDDTFVFGDQGGDAYRKVNTVKVVKRAPKAEPEDDPTDCSSDEAQFKKMFTYKNKKLTKSVTPQIISTTVKPGNLTISPLELKPQHKPKVVKKVLHVPASHQRSVSKNLIEIKRPPNSPHRTYTNKHAQVSQRSQESLKGSLQGSQRSLQGSKRSQGSKGTSLLKSSSTANKQTINYSLMKKEQKESMNEEYLDDDMEDISEKPREHKTSKQRLMFPEVMDEDVPTDGDSESDDESLYSELPSSESESEDWFTLDIRAERAGDYMPLLGDKAYKLLSEERNRVKARLDTLKRSLAALSDSGRELADQLKDATNTVAELDAMLRAA
ncbi:hypothetical protein O0L34_g15441 [Tuta absoluta]|nr:hypothetical protein O0L34_g15441 [Tuta absoluta]